LRDTEASRIARHRGIEDGDTEASRIARHRGIEVAESISLWEDELER
jgi:RNA polymerase subunit RPABC4/transcription elongation factor Spt4